ETGGEPGAAATLDPGLLDGLDHLARRAGERGPQSGFRLHRGQGHRGTDAHQALSSDGPKHSARHRSLIRLRGYFRTVRSTWVLVPEFGRADEAGPRPGVVGARSALAHPGDLTAGDLAAVQPGQTLLDVLERDLEVAG